MNDDPTAGAHGRSRPPARRPPGYEAHREDVPALKAGVTATLVADPAGEPGADLPNRQPE